MAETGSEVPLPSRAWLTWGGGAGLALFSFGAAGMLTEAWGYVFGSCLFIAYVPVKRLIHSCATPMGRLMNSQKGMLEAKRRASISGLFQGRVD